MIVVPHENAKRCEKWKYHSKNFKDLICGLEKS